MRVAHSTGAHFHPETSHVPAPTFIHSPVRSCGSGGAAAALTATPPAGPSGAAATAPSCWAAACRNGCKLQKMVPRPLPVQLARDAGKRVQAACVPCKLAPCWNDMHPNQGRPEAFKQSPASPLRSCQGLGRVTKGDVSG